MDRSPKGAAASREGSGINPPGGGEAINGRASKLES